MLLGVQSDGVPQYETFKRATIAVPLKPAPALAAAADMARAEGAISDDREPGGAEPSLASRVATSITAGFSESPFGYRALLAGDAVDAVRDLTQQAPNAPGRGQRALDAGLAHTRKLLAFYNPPNKIGRTYETDRLEGSRQPALQAPVRRVHVYEMFWADISMLGADPLRFFSSLYQLVMHLCELGRLAIEDGLTEFSTSLRWRSLLWWQSMAVRMLSIPIPIINILLLITLLGAVLVRLTAGRGFESAHSTGGIVAVFVTTIAIMIGATFRTAAPPKPAQARDWWPLPSLAVVAGAVLAYMLTRVFRADVILLVEWWILAGILFDFILRKYEFVRPGARKIGRPMFYLTAIMVAVTLVMAFRNPNTAARAVEYGAFWSMQTLFLVLEGSWLLFFASGIIAAGLGVLAPRKYQGAERARACAAIRTSRLALAVSASTMLALIVVVWSGLLAWGVRSVQVFECMRVVMFKPMTYSPWILATPESIRRWLTVWPDDYPCFGVTDTVHGYFRGILLMSTTSGLPVMLLFIALALMMLIWMAYPSVRLETSAPSTCNNAESDRAGAWLSRGLDGVRVAVAFWWIAFFAVLAIFAAGDAAVRHGWFHGTIIETVFRTTPALSLPLLQTAGSLIAASAATLLFALAKFGGFALDVALDVDNYLRERPKWNTPRARIFERYASLLRTIAGYRDQSGRGYDAVVIVAHSLGGLITADLLRYLNSESEAGRGDPALQRLGYGAAKNPPGVPTDIPVYFFSMGNPLRQLLNRFFPHQYSWVRSTPDGCTGRTDPGADFDWSSCTTPDAATLGIKHWTNAFRSGDYVGRSIWLNEWFRRNDRGDREGGYPDPILVYTAPARSEMCIGLGAHTHYWDETAPDIRDSLDALILNA